MHVVVIVLGDLGRSPRMQYHSLSLLENGHSVTLVGYTGEHLIPRLLEYPNQLQVVRFTVPTPLFLQKIRVVYFVWRIFSLALWLAWILLGQVTQSAERLGPIDWILVQNPPALPLIVMAKLYCWYYPLVRHRHASATTPVLSGHAPGLVVDWHNIGYSMLGRPGSIIQMVAKLYERIVAPFADAHWTVTKAMKEFLETDMGLPAHRIGVLPDCPPAMFQTRFPNEQHAILRKLHDQICAACPQSWYTGLPMVQAANANGSGRGGEVTLFTESDENGNCSPRRGRPALVTSSTSWTPDEDFGILLEAAMLLDQAISKTETNLKVIIVVTGKGPEKAMYEQQISLLAMTHVSITTMWLEPADYPLLIACADVGVSLHTSTSGLDLPMKVLDLFGCQVPVCAMEFACLPELVQDHVNGRVFSNSHELAGQLFDLLSPLNATERVGNHSFGKLERYSLQLQGRQRWSDNWNERALPILEKRQEQQQQQQDELSPKSKVAVRTGV